MGQTRSTKVERLWPIGPIICCVIAYSALALISSNVICMAGLTSLSVGNYIGLALIL